MAKLLGGVFLFTMLICFDLYSMNRLNKKNSVHDPNDDDGNDNMNQEDEVDGPAVDDSAPIAYMNKSGLSFPKDMNVTESQYYSGGEFDFDDDIYEEMPPQPVLKPTGDEMIGM
jgi:hypothetical protein